MKTLRFYLTLLLSASLLFLITLQGCGGSEDETIAEQDQEENMDPYLEQLKERLTPFELEHGIGPVTERVEIDEEINDEMVMRGREIFEMKCEACHSLNEDKIGPSLGEVVGRRSPEFVMNFILNPGENVLNHPVGLDLLADHHTEMPFRDVTVDEARDIYEYLRDIFDTN